METVKVEALKLNPEFFCTKTGTCNRMYVCINPQEPLFPVCKFLIIRSLNKKISEYTDRMKREDD